MARPHLGAFPPGLPRGEIEDCGEFGVWWYTAGDAGHRWAFALKSTRKDVVWFEVGRPVSHFRSREDAMHAGTLAAKERAEGCSENPVELYREPWD